MLFDHFGGHFAFRAPKWSKFNRFYKVFWSTFVDAPKCSRTNAFSTFREVVKRHQLLVKNLMLFWSFGCLFAFWAPKSSKFIRFYKVFWPTFSDAPKWSRTNAFLTFRRVAKRLPLLVENLMLCWSFWDPFCDLDSKIINIRHVL